MNESTTIDKFNDRFTVITRDKVFFISNPQTAIIPVRLNGQMTSERGFLVCYSTTDEKILRALHKVMCQNLEIRPFAAMLFSIRNNCSILSCQFMEDHEQYITGYKY